MRLDRAVSTAWHVLRNRPSDLLPLYVLGLAIGGLTQAGVLLGAALIGLYLSLTGRLETIRDNFSRLGGPPDPERAPDAFAAWTESLGAALEPAMTLPVGVIGIGTALAVVLVAVLTTAAVTAGRLAGSLGRLRDERGLVAGLAGARRYWRSILALYVLELVAWIGLTLLAVLLAQAGPIGVLVAVLGWLVGAISVRAIFAFAPVAVVVDETGALSGLRYAASYVRHRPIEAAGYYLVAIVAFVGFGVVTAALGRLGVAAGTGLGYALFVLPLLDLVKTTLYGGGRFAIDPPARVERSLVGQVVRGLGRSLRELFGFVKAAPGVHTIATVTLVGGVVAGWFLAAPLAGAVESSIAGRLVGHSAPVAAAEFFGNNWTVALTMAFAGFFAVVPAIVTLAFNGLAIGVVARTEVELAELLAFMAPHGVIELPAIVVAGAVGIFLGTTWVRTWRGSGSRLELADALERAFWVLLGIGILLAIAALIEGFVSPYYWRPFL
ncbi:hypothetical protein C479_11715 [Halovivax asiaticus JCM 14624]|uniref:Stage II sporulation protein M n=1 Tax=Halovivax asiaticus JCM 14624 TaxID=1227490 RepID=M0BGR1_9EURY|nr:stage II sporulation protein M [Halovivax asiaticus]ELZ09483.1 hypothetical protein C479_11715 [Halovivax asiaticus JCM 14624]